MLQKHQNHLKKSIQAPYKQKPHPAGSERKAALLRPIAGRTGICAATSLAHPHPHPESEKKYVDYTSLS